MAHPRTTLRQEIVELLRSALPAGAFVASGRARDLPTSSKISALVYTPAESISQEPSGDGSPRRPAMRQITLVIVVQCITAGDGSEALSLADEMSRAVEDAINENYSNINLQATESSVGAAKDAVAEIALTFSVDFFDGE